MIGGIGVSRLWQRPDLSYSISYSFRIAVRRNDLKALPAPAWNYIPEFFSLSIFKSPQPPFALRVRDRSGSETKGGEGGLPIFIVQGCTGHDYLHRFQKMITQICVSVVRRLYFLTFLLFIIIIEQNGPSSV